mmetsp:Transcript_55853/g.136821  ORF Transcript_55853/g.136821 Transcript_55853/m.136821 type:complete len:232 (+) Transcript_55853:1692-2387(+)
MPSLGRRRGRLTLREVGVPRTPPRLLGELWRRPVAKLSCHSPAAVHRRHASVAKGRVELRVLLRGRVQVSWRVEAPSTTASTPCQRRDCLVASPCCLRPPPVPRIGVLLVCLDGRQKGRGARACLEAWRGEGLPLHAIRVDRSATGGRGGHARTLRRSHLGALGVKARAPRQEPSSRAPPRAARHAVRSAPAPPPSPRHGRLASARRAHALRHIPHRDCWERVLLVHRVAL